MSALESRLRRVDSRYKSDRAILIVAVIFGFVLQVMFAFLVFQPDRVADGVIRLEELQVEGPSEVCPGDTLQYSYTIRTVVDVVAAIDAATYRDSDPVGLTAWSDTRRLVMPAGASSRIAQSWFVPTRYYDWVSGVETEMQPGQYRRIIAVGTVIRNTLPHIQSVQFTVKEDCK